MGKRKHEEPVEDEERYFLNPSSVSVHLFCSICQDVFTDPQRAPCGHSFCKKCITQWLKNSKTCPEDRKTVTIQQLHHDFILENIIGDQKVACPFRRSGCEFIDQLQLLKSHKNNCKFNPANLPGFLKEEEKKQQPNIALQCVADPLDESEPVPSLGRPSLKMRLFLADEKKKRLLSNMFDEDDKSPS